VTPMKEHRHCVRPRQAHGCQYWGTSYISSDRHSPWIKGLFLLHQEDRLDGSGSDDTLVGGNYTRNWWGAWEATPKPGRDTQKIVYSARIFPCNTDMLQQAFACARKDVHSGDLSFYPAKGSEGGLGADALIPLSPVAAENDMGQGSPRGSSPRSPVWMTSSP
jgi:hypothetical protein